MSFRSTTRASSPNATAPFDPHARLVFRCPLRLFLAPSSAPVTSRLVTFYACSGLLVQRSWLYSGFDSCFPRVRTVFFLALPDSMCEEARALRELLFWRYWLAEYRNYKMK